MQESTIAYKYLAKRQQIFKESIAGNPAKAENLGKNQKLVMLSKTRWSAWGESCSTIKDGIVPLDLVTSLETLEELGNEKANGLVTVVLQFYFVVTVCIVASVLTITAILSSKLQYETLDLNDASSDANICKKQLKAWIDKQASIPVQDLSHFEQL